MIAVMEQAQIPDERIKVIARWLATPVLALGFTLFVFWAMQTLITSGKSVLNDDDGSTAVNFIHVEKDDALNTKDRKVNRPPPAPKEPPKPEIAKQQITNQKQSLDGIDIGQMDVDMDMGSGLNGINTGDGEYLPIIKVAPIYPRNAAQRGIEGFVVLEFTVNELGAVIDPVVINAEPPGIFNRAAIEAAKKFKYKPKIVDGKAVPVSGVKNLIRFELEKSE